VHKTDTDIQRFLVSVAVKRRNTKDVSMTSHVQKLTSCINGIWCQRAVQMRSRISAVMTLYQVSLLPFIRLCRQYLALMCYCLLVFQLKCPLWNSLATF